RTSGGGPSSTTADFPVSSGGPFPSPRLCSLFRSDDARSRCHRNQNQRRCSRSRIVAKCSSGNRYQCVPEDSSCATGTFARTTCAYRIGNDVCYSALVAVLPSRVKL